MKNGVKKAKWVTDHSPRKALPSWVSRFFSVLPHQSHSYNPFSDTGHVNGPCGQREGIGGFVELQLETWTGFDEVKEVEQTQTQSQDTRFHLGFNLTLYSSNSTVPHSWKRNFGSKRRRRFCQVQRCRGHRSCSCFSIHPASDNITPFSPSFISTPILNF